MNMKNLANIIVSLALLAVLLIILGFARNEQQKISCSEVKIIIDYRGSDTLLGMEHIRNLIVQRYRDPVGQIMKPEQLIDLKKAIAANPYVERCDIDLLLDGTLRIRARQRTPVIRLMANGNSWYISRDGVVMPVNRFYSARVPLAGGNFSNSQYLTNGNNLLAFADTNRTFAEGNLHRVITLAGYVHNDALLRSMIDQIYIDAKGEIELFTFIGRQRILLGDISDLDHKFRNLISFYRSGPGITRLDQYKTINLKYRNQVVCSK
jgi:cell division protein FtsQ